MVDLKAIPKVDIKKVNALLSPRAFNDLNDFIEHLPQNAGKTVLIAAAIAWIFTAALGLFTTMKAQDLNNLRAQLQDAKALKPIVPVLKETPLDAKALQDLASRLSNIYTGLEIRPNNNTLVIASGSTSMFSTFREAIMQIGNMDAGWKIDIQSMCLGRECPQKQLSITLKIAKIKIDKPESKAVSYLPGASSKSE